MIGFKAIFFLAVLYDIILEVIKKIFRRALWQEKNYQSQKFTEY